MAKCAYNMKITHRNNPEEEKGEKEREKTHAASTQTRRSNNNNYNRECSQVALQNNGNYNAMFISGMLCRNRLWVRNAHCTIRLFLFRFFGFGLLCVHYVLSALPLYSCVCERFVSRFNCMQPKRERRRRRAKEFSRANSKPLYEDGYIFTLIPT